MKEVPYKREVRAYNEKIAGIVQNHTDKVMNAPTGWNAFYSKLNSVIRAVNRALEIDIPQVKYDVSKFDTTPLKTKLNELKSEIVKPDEPEQERQSSLDMN